jgi:glycosyltransferase involved in cell wall biosynthesis
VKFIAVQAGARRGYAVPLILEKAGMLERFYTDLAGNVGLGRLLGIFRHFVPSTSPIARLANRQVPREIADKTLTFGAGALPRLLGDIVGSADPAARFRRHVAAARRSGRAMVRAGFGNATHVFTMLGEGGEFVREAHERGLFVVAEVYILLATERIMQLERQSFPDWEPDIPDYAELRELFDVHDVLMRNTDFYICPSEAVRDDLVQNRKVASERTAVIPYGMDPRWLELEPRPQAGRVLFVGTAELRKGIHYLARAAEMLHADGRNYEFRVVGNVSDRVRRQAVCRNLTFIGRVPRNRIAEEYQQADVFVLPSLAEGSAEVTYEALAAGIPVIATPEVGSVVRNGVEGRIIPSRDPNAAAVAIAEIVQDRERRERMSRAAWQRATEFTWECYGDRLVSVLMSLPQTQEKS